MPLPDARFEFRHFFLRQLTPLIGSPNGFLLIPVSSKVGGSLIVKPSADASPHVQKMMQHSSKPLTLTVLRANEFVYMDRDGDGHVTLDEIMDTDGDGKVSEKEKSMFDTDGDGKVTLEEVQQVS